jgi:hypothetical protein
MQNSPQTQLYNILITRDFEPEILDAKGVAVDNPDEATMFSFDWKTENKNYGTVVILFGEDNNLKIFFGDNLGRSMEGADKSEWYEFLSQVKEFSVRNNLMGFDIENLNRLKYTMQGIAAIKEGLFEGYYGNKKFSYSDQPKQVKLVIKHNRPLGEGDKRYRNIESLFVETQDGERFKVPSKNLAHGRMLSRHISEGGNPYDAFGQHINEIVSEMSTLSKFVRAARSKQFSGEAAAMCETAVRHYQDLKDKAKRIISQRGYHRELESYDPAAATNAQELTDSIRNMFIEQSLDSRIEEAIPLLTKLSEMGRYNDMKEADQFESWADSVTEGTWATPDSPASESKLKELMAQELPVGPDATNATEQLYDVFGDDELFDQLADLADQDANADARPLVQARLAELGIDIEMPSTAVAPPENPAAAATPPAEEPVQSEDIDVEGVMRTVPSNMSSESVERILRLAQLLK